MKRREGALTLEEATAVYDLLEKHVGATEHWRENFIYTQTDHFCIEYRFMGDLGFGGKFYRANGTIFVSCYRESETPELRKRIDAVNEELKLLESTWMPENS